LFEKFKNSVAGTIGIEFEIIKIDNTNNIYSICEAYNQGAGLAKFQYVCFAHEDILFTSKNWGLILKEIFENDNKVGAVGVAGSKYKSLAPGGWPNGVVNLDCINLIQCYGNEKALQLSNPENNNLLVEVKVLDGVFLFTRKTIWEINQFDSQTFKGFHGYDLDFCLQVGRQYKIMVTYQFLIEHKSVGMQNKDWMINAVLLSKKWNDYLPVGNLTYKEKRDVEWAQKKLFALKMRVCGFSFSQVLSVFLRFGYVKFFSFKGNFLFVVEIFNSTLSKLGVNVKTAS
jgi:Glycosyltransferase like family